MTLRKKILLSNIFMVLIPIILTITIWKLYILFNNDSLWIKSIDWATKQEDSVATKQNILYLFEAEFSDDKWESVMVHNQSGKNSVLKLDEEKLREITQLGFHLSIASEDAILFSNMNENDLSLLENMKISETKVDGSLHWIENFVVIRDQIMIDENPCVLTAIYNKKNADIGVINSMVPMYMVSYTVLILFSCVAACSFAFMAFILAKWLNHSVVEPLEELKKGTNYIATNNFDYQIDYTRKDEFGDVCREFDNMRKVLKTTHEDRNRYEKERQELLRGISHDLRSPLTSIRGYTEGILEGVANNEEKRKKYCEAILIRTSDMERLTDNLSEFVHLDNREVVLKKSIVNIVDYIGKILENYTLYMENNNVKVEYTSKIKEAYVSMDVFHMDRVFNNIIENTVKHRSTDNSIIKINLTEGSNEKEIQIEFLDNNADGVKENQLTRIFESFYRGNASRTKPENGSGLGLAVVKSIINQHGGRVEAFLDNGLGIRIYLPIDDERSWENEKNFDC